MVTNITNFGRSGLSDWLLQRASAVILALYTLFVVGYLLLHPNLDYATWSGLFGGVTSTMLLGALFWWATPFDPLQSACMSLVIAVMGFAGSMTLSAIKRDRGVKDYGTLVEGHAGVLDRIDSICFAAPVFFHLTRYFFHLR